MHDFAPAPHPVIAPVHGSAGSGGAEVPTGYAIAYAAIALIVWIGTAIVLARHTNKRGERGYDPGEAVALSAVPAMMWPLSAVAAGVWWIVARVTRTPTPAPKADPRPVPLGSYFACPECLRPAHPESRCTR